MTGEPRKVYRTAAFKVEEEGQAMTVFWSLEPTYFKPGNYYIRKHELYASGSWSGGVTREDLSEGEALQTIEAMEREAVSKYPAADPVYRNHMWIGNEYRDAPHISLHPARLSERNLERLRARKRPGLGLK